MKIFSPHRRREPKRKFGGKEFQSKVKKAQGYKRVFGPRPNSSLAALLRFLRLDSAWAQALVLGALAVIGYYLVISPQFVLAEVEVTGTQRVTPDQVREALFSAGEDRWLLIPKTHLLILSKGYAQELITERQPLVKEIASYRRVWPNRVEIEIVERTPGFALSVGGADYLVDEEGVVVRELDDLSGLPHVIDQVNETVEIGEQLTNTKLVAFVLSVARQWPEKIDPPMREIKIPGKAAGFAQFMSAEGWGVFLDFARPADSQLANLNLILTRQIPARNRLQLAYIDLRLEKWAYYCYKDSPCQSQPQEELPVVTPTPVPSLTPTGVATPTPLPTPTESEVINDTPPPGR